MPGCDSRLCGSLDFRSFIIENIGALLCVDVMASFVAV